MTIPTDNRIRSLEELSNPVEDRPLSDGGGGIVLVKITGLHPDSPTSGVRIYTGDIYGDGSAETATEDDVTIRIPGIAADVSAPSYGDWADIPHCGAIPISQTWTNADDEQITETVYEVIGLLLLS